MQIVIEIPEDSYKATCNGYMLPQDVENVVQGIKNGTPLPKGHGRLVDVKEILDAYENSYKGTHADDLAAFLSDYVQTVVPADKEKINPYEKCKTCGQNRESCCGCPDVLKLEQKIRGTQNDRDISR